MLQPLSAVCRSDEGGGRLIAKPCGLRTLPRWRSLSSRPTSRGTPSRSKLLITQAGREFCEGIMKNAETYDYRVRCMRKDLLVMPRIGGIFGAAIASFAGDLLF
jgi:hypothetical protein